MVKKKIKNLNEKKILVSTYVVLIDTLGEESARTLAKAMQARGHSVLIKKRNMVSAGDGVTFEYESVEFEKPFKIDFTEDLHFIGGKNRGFKR